MNSMTYGVRAAVSIGLGLLMTASVLMFATSAFADDVQTPLVEVTTSETVVSDVQAPVVEEQAPAAEEVVVEESVPAVEETAPVEEPASITLPAVEETVVEVVAEPVVEAPAEEAAPAPVEEPAGEVLGESVQVVAEEAAPVATPELSTEKADYHPGQTATIFGNLFQSLQTIVLKIFGSDDEGGNYVESSQTLATDENGYFSTTYTLDDLYRPFYEMTASALDGSLLASGWFRDSAVGTYDQCSNDKGEGYTVGDIGCRYANGNLNKNNSTYYEGDSTVQRVWLEGYVPGATHTVTFHYGTTKAGKHAYDFLTSWNHSESWITDADLCQDIAGCTSATPAYGTMQQDTSANNHDNFLRQFEIRGGTITNVSVPTLVSGSYAGDSETAVTVSFTVGNSGSMCDLQSKVPVCDVAIFFGAHVSDSEDWTPQLTAIDIPGSPYHVALAAEDGESVGQRDNQMQTDAIVVPSTGTIIVDKVTVPAGDTQSFAFTTGGTGYTGFSLTDAAAPNSQDLEAGVYSVSETVPAGWSQTSATCVSSLGHAETVGNIDLNPDEVVTCTFTNTKRGEIVLVKNTVGGDGSFNFVHTIDGLDSALTTTAGTDSDTSNKLVPGDYSISETVPAGWDLTSATCDQGETIENITVGAGETVTCTFTNTKRGNIVIVKDVIGNPDPTDFTFQNNFGNGNPASFMLDEDADVTLPSSRSFEVLPGTYAVSEDALAGWQLEGATCDQGETIGSIDVAPGETVTCTFVNEELISITLIKNTVGGNGDFDFDATGAGLPADIDLTTVAGTATQTFNGLDQDDTFSIAENVPAGWALTSATCTGGNTPASITPEPGEDVTCTFTNTKNGSITIVKDVVGTDKDFGFTGAIAASLGDSDSSSLSVAPGQYVVTESADAAYALTSLTCTDANSTGNTGTRAATFNVEAGENVTCTFVNSELPTLTLEKTVTNDNGGTATQDDFQGMIDGVDQAWDVAKTLTPGSYTASETTLSTYTASDWGGNCAANGSVMLAYGDHKTCSITNDDKAPSLTLNKITNYSYGGTAPESSWMLTADGGSAGTLSGAGAAGSADVVSGATFKAGTYTLSESAAPTGYTNGASYSCVKNGGQAVAGNSITLALGDTAVCSITNTDIAPQLTVIKHVINDNGGTAVAGEFTMNVTATQPSDDSFPGVEDPGTTIALDAGSFSVAEVGVTGYTQTSAVGCEGTIAVGETKTCTITNDDIAPVLHLRKFVTNDNGGTATVSDFTLTANGTDANDLSGTSPVDSGAGLKADTFALSESAVAGYTASAWNCVGGTQNGSNITLGLGQEATCTITNDDIAPKLIVIKHVINDNGGLLEADDFTMNVTATNPSDASFAGAEAPGTEITLDAGAYSVDEGAVAGYAKTLGADCSGTAVIGVTKTCTITNDDIAPKLTIVKDATPNDAQDFLFHMTGKTDFSLDDDEGVVDGGGINQPRSMLFNVSANSPITTTEVQPNAFWELAGVTCVNTVGGTPHSFTNVAGGVTITLGLAEDVTCTFTNNKLGGPTRTQGFWQTHTTYTSAQFGTYFPAGMTVGTGAHTRLIDNLSGTAASKLYGAYYSSIAKLTTGPQRAALDKARMQLLQQLVTAKLNCATFGCTASVSAMVAAADAAYAGNSVNAILVSAGQMDAYNNSGDTIIIGNAGKATPKVSQSLANKMFWNLP